MAKRKPKTGYCQPPLASRFRPGVSGNPNGRPRGSRNRASPLRASFDEIVEIMRGDGNRVGWQNKLMACRIILELGHGPPPGDEPLVPALIRRLAAMWRNAHGR